MDTRVATGFKDIFEETVTRLSKEALQIQHELLVDLRQDYADKLAGHYTSRFISRHQNQLVADFVKRMHGKLCENPLSSLRNLRSFITSYRKFQNEAKNNECLAGVLPLFENSAQLDKLSIKFFRAVNAQEQVLNLELCWFYAFIGQERECEIDEQNIKDMRVSKEDTTLLRAIYNTYPARMQYCENKISLLYLQMLWDEEKVENEVNKSLVAYRTSPVELMEVIKSLQGFIDLQGDDFDTYKEKIDKKLSDQLENRTAVENYKADYWLEVLRKALISRKKAELEKVAAIEAEKVGSRLKAKFATLSESEKSFILKNGDCAAMRQYVYFDRERTVTSDLKQLSLQSQTIFFICRSLLAQMAEQLKVSEKELFWERFIYNRKDIDSYISNGNLKQNKNNWYKEGYENPESELMIDVLIKEMQYGLSMVEDLDNIEQLEAFIEEQIANYFECKLKLEEHRRENNSHSTNYKKMLLLDWEREIKLFAACLTKDFKLVIKAVQGEPLIIKQGKDTSNKQVKYELYQELARSYERYMTASSKRKSVATGKENLTTTQQIPAARHSMTASTSSGSAPVVRRSGFASFLKWVVTFFAVLFCCTADSEEVSQVRNETKKNSRVKHVRHVSQAYIYKSMGKPDDQAETHLHEKKTGGASKEVISNDAASSLHGDHQNAVQASSNSEVRLTMH